MRRHISKDEPDPVMEKMPQPRQLRNSPRKKGGPNTEKEKQKEGRMGRLVKKKKKEQGIGRPAKRKDRTMLTKRQAGNHPVKKKNHRYSLEKR